MTESYDIGDMQTLSIAFTDSAGTATDPTGITFKMREPDGTETNYVHGTDAQLVKDSVGNYHVDWLFSQSGRHVFKFSGTGAINTAEQQEIYIRKGI